MTLLKNRAGSTPGTPLTTAEPVPTPSGTSKIIAFLLPTLLLLVIGGVYVAGSRFLDHRGHYVAARACDLLTPPAIRSFLGADYVKSDVPLQEETDAAVTATACIYHTPTSSIADSREIEVDVRAARTRTGNERNRKQFDHPVHGATDVPGLGEKAYWVGKPGALLIFAHHNWYTFWAGATEAGHPRSREQSEALARVVFGQE